MRLGVLAVLIACVSLMHTPNARAQTVAELNLGFEQAGDPPSKPKAWATSGDGFAAEARGYQVGLDDSESKSGKRSLKMKSTGQGGFGNAFQTLPGSVAAGKHVKISGWIKTKNVAASGYAGLWCRIDGTGGMLAHDNSVERIDANGKVTHNDRGTRGTTDWKLCSVEHDVPTAAQAIVFGVLLVGDGTAWWDDFAVEIGPRLRHASGPLHGGEPRHWPRHARSAPVAAGQHRVLCPRHRTAANDHRPASSFEGRTRFSLAHPSARPPQHRGARSRRVVSRRPSPGIRRPDRL